MPPINCNWHNTYIISLSKGLVHQVRDWYRGAAAYFGWIAKRRGQYPLWSSTDERQSGRLKDGGRRVAIKMGRRLRCSSVTYRFRYAPSSALPAAHFDRNAAIPVTDLVH